MAEYNYNLPKANCYGFVIGKNESISIWDEMDASNLFQTAYELFKDMEEIPRKIYENEFIAEKVAQTFCAQRNFKIVAIGNDIDPSTLPDGTIAMRIYNHFFFGCDFHFAIKSYFAGESCWLHKPGQLPADIMLNEDIIAPQWKGGYDTPTIFMISR